MSTPTKDWKDIIWREINHCNDPDYAEYLHLAIEFGYFNWLRESFNKLRPRPLVSDVESALYQMSEVDWSGSHVWAKYLRRLEKEKRKNRDLEVVIGELDSHYWLNRFIARHVLFYRGGEAIERLQAIANDSTSDVQETASWLVKSIIEETRERLAEEPGSWICSHCFVHCMAHYLPTTSSLTYYGCRVCKRSWGLVYAPDNVVCILDEDWLDTYKAETNQLKVNWMLHKAMFDFDRVKIIKATDKDVEHFAIQVGNDTEPQRESNYPKMHCTIDERCQLSLNTVRILENLFGAVEKTDGSI
ncbi:MAG: hypothetical protein AAF485_01075 [Chloroflexota bacterium]